MIKLSRSSGYAFCVVGYLAQGNIQGSVRAKTLSEHFKIPHEYLFKVLRQLVRTGILESVRGPHGGFRLSRPRHQISMLDVIEAVEGPWSDGEIPTARHEERYYQRLLQVYRQAGREMCELFGRTTVAELLRETDR